MNTKKITDIKTATLNSRKIKLFSLWERLGDAWVFAGQYSAPLKTANKNLLAYVNGGIK